ncbi:MAG: hypothetical protein QOH24_1810 [Verrucomicrobiota bacterium]|jgi:hypothetical protein
MSVKIVRMLTKWWQAAPNRPSLSATASLVTIDRVSAPLRSQVTESFWANLHLIIDRSARPPRQLLTSDGSAAPWASDGRLRTPFCFFEVGAIDPIALAVR